MKHLLLSERAAERFGGRLEALGYSVVPLPASDALEPLCRDHADTLIFPLAGSLLAGSRYASALCLPEELAGLLVTTDDEPSGSYPGSARFNALPLGGCLYGRMASVSSAVREEFSRRVDVKQGYARCAVLALSAARAAVTADEGMARAMEENGVKVLRVRPGFVRLDGRDDGFFGGACFTDDPECCCSLHTAPSVVTFGSLSSHPDGEAVRAFIRGRGYTLTELDGELTDYGGAVVVRMYKSTESYKQKRKC